MRRFDVLHFWKQTAKPFALNPYFRNAKLGGYAQVRQRSVFALQTG